jgi:hypothetical protein
MAILTKGTTFANGDSVSSSKLNSLVDSAAFVSGASGTTDDATLQVNGSGQLAVKTVQTTNLANLSVTAGKLAADSVETAKILNANVTLAKMASASVDVSKMTTDSFATVAQVRAQTAAKIVTADVVKESPFVAVAYGTFTITNTSRTLTSAQNIATCTRGSSDETDITFTNAMASTAYVVVGNTSKTGASGDSWTQNLIPHDKDTTGFSLSHHAEGANRTIDFVVFGVLA